MINDQFLESKLHFEQSKRKIYEDIKDLLYYVNANIEDTNVAREKNSFRNNFNDRVRQVYVVQLILRVINYFSLSFSI